MKKILLTSFLILFLISSIATVAYSYVIKSGISMINSVPKELYGTWSVQSTRISTDSPKTFAEVSNDVWNLRRSANVIELRNPMTGAIAEVYLDNVDNNYVTFSHYEREGTTKVKDTVRLHIKGDTFTGTNELTIDSLREDDNRYTQITKKAVYSLTGKKVSGMSIY